MVCGEDESKGVGKSTTNDGESERTKRISGLFLKLLLSICVLKMCKSEWYVRGRLLNVANVLLHVLSELLPHGDAQLALQLVRVLHLGVQHLPESLNLLLGLCV